MENMETMEMENPGTEVDAIENVNDVKMSVEEIVCLSGFVIAAGITAWYVGEHLIVPIVGKGVSTVKSLIKRVKNVRGTGNISIENDDTYDTIEDFKE